MTTKQEPCPACEEVQCMDHELRTMTTTKQEQPQEILQRLRKIQDEELKDALATLLRLRDGGKVTDGDLVDAAFAFTARTDLANPIVPLMSYFIERFMVYGGITETPKGLKRDYFTQRFEP